MIGQTISHYRILEKLGEGGMGVVYRAHDTQLERHVALKFLPHYLTGDPTQKERFYQEARAASALNHPNITTIHEISEHDGQLFIVMELVEGKTLKELVQSEPLTIRKVLDIAIQVGEGFAAAHEKGIVHRDVKSENVMLTPKGQAKIMDFGLAQVKGAVKLTKTGSTLGTAAYMSPEQAQGEDVDHRSDIFSFGVVLYELLTGRLPFRGEHQAALLYSIINEEPQPVARFNEKVGDELQRIVGKALAKDREERYQHVDDMVADLRRERKALEYSKVSSARTSLGQEPGALREAPREAGREPLPAAGTPGMVREPVPSPGIGGDVRPSPEAKAAGTAKPRRTILPILFLEAVIVLAIVVIAIINPFHFKIGPKKAVDRDTKSVAVLPFVNMSGDKGDEFFSDGITEDIIAALSNISELKVISRTSIMQYKNTSKSVRDIAKELNVATVLEGSVRRADNQVRIVAQLIDATSDKHLWARTYDKELTQIFAIQSDVAQQIASALRAELSPQQRQLVAKKPTENLDAYSYYLKGREYYYRYSKQDNETAIELFKKALELDPGYALAYAGLGDAYEQRTGKFGFPEAWVDSSIAVSKKAIALDPNLAEGYKALGLAYSGKGWLRKSLEAYQQAVEINPNYQPALLNIGHTFGLLGRLDEAFGWRNKALALDPMFPYSYMGVGDSYLQLCDDARALECFNKALSLQPDLVAARQRLAYAYLMSGKYEECVEQAQKILSLEADDTAALDMAGLAELLLGNYAEAEKYLEKCVAVAVDSQYGTAGLGYVYLKTGRLAEARRMFARGLRYDRKELEEGNEYSGIPYDLARINAMQGNKEEAYKWLQKSIDAGGRDYRYTSLDPCLESLRNDDRFKQMVADVKAKVDEMRKRVEETEKE